MGASELLLLIVIFGLLFDYTNGFHDAANVVSTVIATKVLRPIVAILMAGVLNMIGATQISGVAHTITSGLVQSQEATQIMILSALIGAIGWNLITWYFGIPSSSSYALIGGLVGAAWFYGGPSIIIWNGVLAKVVIPMFISPFAGFALAYLIMKGLYFFLTHYHRKQGEKYFRYMQIGSSSLVALAHGLNDAQKSMGIITLGLFSSGFIATTHIPFWVIIACAITMGLGTAAGGFRIIRTVGFEITKIRPIQGFAAESGASLVILTASFLSMPISSTHMIVGSVAGVGAAKKFASVQWSLSKKLVTAWFLTLPGAAAIAAVSYKFFIFIGI